MNLHSWSVLKSRVLLERWWIRIREDHVRLPNGVELEEFHVFEYPDWACVLCETQEGDMVMVEQYRHGVGQVMLECPAGVIGEGEDPLDAAKRELAEETGFRAKEWILLGRCATEPARHTNTAHFYYARGAMRVEEPAPDQSEELRLVCLSKDELLGAVDSGRFAHGVQLAGFFYAVQKGLLTICNRSRPSLP